MSAARRWRVLPRPVFVYRLATSGQGVVAQLGAMMEKNLRKTRVLTGSGARDRADQPPLLRVFL